MNKAKILIVVGIIILIGLFFVYIVLARLRTKSTLVNNDGLTGQTTNGQPNIRRPSTQASPTIEYVETVDNNILSTTGDSDNMPPLEITIATQRGELLSALPLETEIFQIAMDYKLAKYQVTFRDGDNQENRSTFEKWLQNNYPNLTIEEFEFQ
jgi:hypothetical protein